MGHTNSHELARRLPIAALLAIPLLAFQASVFAGDATEPERLAVLMRQLDMLDRLAEHSERLPKQDASRYHFDYARLREDIERVRSGIRDYLTPQRAQPRDPTTLIGDYRQEAEDAP
ncbi:plasmid conserved hypothetical protein RAQPRD [Thioalkalivibrio sulfidiphilus HL-EbGr7]|uniref:Raqprd family integrative conjugative element protein n=1 Tax=Thioalkalivibrio sulfidiphilus (strain HL-EbGR7) TaxID=396588 RepID=B8GNN3_THISH|nr:RAQPRD family integrative conjugative element protein [Thioalkalivibrio sulfidiphilus]ACL73924.1 plasmid conserved hypothetical protein RAQPRD [Thioalkalivibrio sulfidiphilus HL-EbGr7]